MKRKQQIVAEVKKVRRMKFSLILFAVLWCGSISDASSASETSPSETLGCFKIDKNGARFQFFCSNRQEFFNETCVDSKLSEAIQNSKASEVTELRISGCEVNVLNFALKEFENVADLDISNGNDGWPLPDWADLHIPINNKITKLNASNNYLYTPSKSFIANLTKLEVLDISGNSLERIPDFELPTSLKEIRLEKNQIKRLPCDGDSLKRWMYSTNVFVSWKSMWVFSAALDIHCISERIKPVFDSEEFITFRNGAFELHYNNQTFNELKWIIARSDQMENVDQFVSEVGPTLQSLTSLTMYGSDEMTEFDFTEFKSISRLQKLTISSNGHLKRVKNPAALYSINLKQFAVFEARIENAREIIENLNPSIEYLRLSGNPIGEINQNTFKKLSNLKNLHLSDTNLTIIDSDPFEPLTSLEYLDISHNNFSDFNFTILSATLQRLNTFKVFGCQIKTADDILKHIGTSISALDLSENPLGEINLNLLQTIERPFELHLSDNNLTSFNFGGLEQNTLIFFLNISFNHLNELNVSSTFSNLQMFDLRGNELSELHNFDREHLPWLRTLGISQNRLSCERLQQLRNEWVSLDFFDDEWNQKDKKCLKSSEIESTMMSTD